MSEAQQVSLDTSVLEKSTHRYRRERGGRFAPGPRSYEWLLKDSLAREWIDGYISEETRQKKLYQLEKVIRAAKLAGPEDLLRRSDREIKNIVRRVANWYLQQGRGVWARQITITVKGFLESQDRRLDLRRSERMRTPARKKIAFEHVPTRAEIYRMAEYAGSPRNKAILLCLFQSGVRVGCLCNWTYSLVGSQLYPELRVPVRVRVTPALDTKLSLYGLSYYVTGFKEEAARALRSYLDFRIEQGWDPRPLDPLFVHADTGRNIGRIKRVHVWRIVKTSARRAGLAPESVWVHCLRKSFRKVLNATPQLDEDTKEALMGHKLPGSRGSYFDYHDEDEVMWKYMQADFSATVPAVYSLPR